ncbi:hypothetical protein M9H77_02039 [Catharanthus roseus]|uniref:Uncharacterized protein n=1 Tax=Catharanthus roseus TaxID=4058 RepID=A0ACC0C7A9_CATRO|nr:hypothetical protein M9H77_02039 [Catharanthus roseus]
MSWRDSGICLEKAATIEFFDAYNIVKKNKVRKMLASRVLPDKPTGRKSAIKITYAAPPLRQGSLMNEGDSGQIHNIVLEIREEKSTNQIPEKKKGRITRHICNGTFVVSKYLSRCSFHVVNEVVKRLNDEQREAVVRMDFGSLLELKTCSLLYDIFSWMTDQYNSKRECFRLLGKDVQVTAEDVHLILGLPIGGTDIESLLVQGGKRGT